MSKCTNGEVLVSTRLVAKDAGKPGILGVAVDVDAKDEEAPHAWHRGPVVA